MNKRFFVRIVPLFITCILLACFSFARPDSRDSSFQLTGKLESRNIKTVTLSYLDVEGRTIVVTDSLLNGVFRFSGFIKEPASATLRCNISTVKINDNNTIDEINIQFADRHPDSYMSAFLLKNALSSQGVDVNRIKVCFLKLSPVVQNSYYGRNLQLRLGINKILPTGAVFPDMDGTDMARNKILIQDSIVQPYTLVIFWASWCAPCRKHMPEYKEIYKQYQSRGLQIMAITSDADKNAWLGAIQKSTIQNWLHVSPGNYEKLWDLCGVTSIPAEILLRGRRVIAKFEGADDNHAGMQALNAKLEEVFESTN